MKYNQFIKAGSLAVVFLFAGHFLTACDDNIQIGNIDEDNYTTTQDVSGYMINGEGKRSQSLAEFRNEGNTDLYLGLSKDAKQAVNATLSYNKALLDAYNAEHNTDYAPFPQELVTFDAGGAATVNADDNKSNPVKLTYRTNTSLQEGVTYVIPVGVAVSSGSVQLPNPGYLVFVKDLTSLPDCAKSTGIKIISCMEINDANPLNNLCFTLKESGKPLIDMLILFSANINIDAQSGRVIVYNNPNVQHLLDNRKKYLKPLQDRGMKVVLGLLGNHDHSGVANMSETTAREYAKEVKAVCDAYNLDGIFYDDEYSDYVTSAPYPPGFVAPSNAAASRLAYEIKRAMPDRLNCAYAYGRTSTLVAVDGVNAGDYIDYGIRDYGVGTDMASNYPGLPRSGMALYSQEFNLGRWTTGNNLTTLRNNGYGAHMIFAMDPFRANFATQLSAMTLIARNLFDDDLVYDGKPYAKDW